MKTCEMTMSEGEYWLHYFPCGKPAKYISPKEKGGRQMYLCGIHKNSVDAMYKRIGSDKRCKKL